MCGNKKESCTFAYNLLQQQYLQWNYQARLLPHSSQEAAFLNVQAIHGNRKSSSLKLMNSTPNIVCSGTEPHVQLLRYKVIAFNLQKCRKQGFPAHYGGALAEFAQAKVLFFCEKLNFTT